MTAQHAFRWITAGGALTVAVVFAALQLKRQQSPVPVPATPTAVAGFERPLVFTFWNVEWFPGRRPNASEKFRLQHIAAVAPVIERLNPDVLGLEEVADEAAAQILADHLTGFRVDACTHFVRDNGEPTRQQTVLCSRLPLIQAGAESWKAGPGGLTPRRGFVFGAYEPVHGKVLLVYGLHLKSNRDDEPGGAETNVAMREEAARQLLVHERAMVKLYGARGTFVLTVIGGDLNTSLDDPRFERETTLRGWLETGFRWAWQGVPVGERLTLPSEGPYPSACFDHVFMDGPGGKLLSIGIEPTGKEASDHRPVTARISL